jgi:hypothetical protein
MRAANFLAVPIVFFSAAVCSAVDVAKPVNGVDASRTYAAAYAVPVSRDELSLNGRLLPIQGADLPVVTTVDTDAALRQAAVPSPVEAIPTPTSFQAGLLVLGLIALARLVRRVRRA